MWFFSEVTETVLLWSDRVAESPQGLLKMQVPIIPCIEVYPHLPASLRRKYSSDSSTKGSGSYLNNGALAFMKRLPVWNPGNVENFSRAIPYLLRHRLCFHFLNFVEHSQELRHKAMKS